MNATSSGGAYRTQESPTGICREVLVYDTHQGDNRVALVTNINNQYSTYSNALLNIRKQGSRH